LIPAPDLPPSKANAICQNRTKMVIENHKRSL